MIKQFIQSCLLILTLFFTLVSCTSSPFEFDVNDFEASISNIPPPVLESVTLDENSQEITFVWTPGEIPDGLEGVTLLIF
jgi:hypothetical protein